jgi:TolB-like protein
MSSVTDPNAFPPPASPAPSVFISYASEDRPAARALRDALAAAGLEVWYDENELTGGDAWDQKIRRQIRDCEYFMPVVSANTEARKEGYFRREWRLAVERSLDMADDVLFLIPVTIDGTPEQGARVPDKFLTVQWLRLPGGQPTPALHHLVRRILSGNHHALTRPPMSYARPPAIDPTAAPPPLITTMPAAAPHHDAPPAMPPFPAVPEKGGLLHGIKFLAESFWWLLTAGWLLFKRLPKWVRIVLTLWFVVWLFSSTRSERPPEKSRSPGDATHKVEAEQAIKTALDEFAQAAREARKSGNAVDLSRLGEQIAARVSQGAADSPAAAGKRPALVLVPFAKLGADDPAQKFGSAVFASLYGRLTLTHGRDIGLLRQPPQNFNEPALLSRGKAQAASYVLAGHLTGEGDARALTVKLLVTEDGSTKWTESFPAANSEPSDVADKIADQLVDLLPKHEGPPRKNPDAGPTPPRPPDAKPTP